MQSCYERYWKDKEGRTKLGDQLEELEITERVLARFGGRAVTTEKRMGARPARIAPAAGEKRSAGGGKQAPTMWLSDATLKAVQVRSQGAVANEVLSYLAREFWITVRPNHLGIALQRHRRAGRFNAVECSSRCAIGRFAICAVD